MLSRRELLDQLSKRLDFLNYSGSHATTLPREELEAIVTYLFQPKEEPKEAEAVYTEQQWAEFNYGAD